MALADRGWADALRADRCLALGLNTQAGELTNGPVGDALGLPSTTPEAVLV